MAILIHVCRNDMLRCFPCCLGVLTSKLAFWPTGSLSQQPSASCLSIPAVSKMFFLYSPQTWGIHSHLLGHDKIAPDRFSIFFDYHKSRTILAKPRHMNIQLEHGIANHAHPCCRICRILANEGDGGSVETGNQIQQLFHNVLPQDMSNIYGQHKFYSWGNPVVDQVSKHSIQGAQLQHKRKPKEDSRFILRE